MSNNYKKYILVTMITLFSCSTPANDVQEAIDHIITATYKQTGLENMFNKLVDDKVPKELRQEFERYSPIISAIATSRLDLKWNF